MFTEMHGNTLVLMALDEAEEVFSENFENHADVSSVWALVFEVVEERDDV